MRAVGRTGFIERRMRASRRTSERGEGEDGIALARHLARRGIRDARVLAAIARVPRDLFVPPALAAEAWADTALPIDCGQTISQPFVVAFMTEALDVRYWHRVLEVGTGSGYQAAVLSFLCRHVYTIERYPRLHEQAKARFENIGLGNIASRVGDGHEGWPEEAPFDRIMVTAAARDMPERLIAQLVPAGKMVLPIGRGVSRQHLYRVTRTDEGLRKERILPVRFVPLVRDDRRGSA